MKKKLTLVVTCVVLVAAMVIGGTLAYFTDTDDATNTFTAGKVDITLNETFDAEKAKLVPNQKIAKVVNVTNNTGSEDAYVRLHIAFPADTFYYGETDGVREYNNLVHFQQRYASMASGEWNWTPNKDGVGGDYPGYPGNGNGYNTYTANIDGKEYRVFVVTYMTKLSAGATTSTDAMFSVYLDEYADTNDGKIYTAPVVTQGEIKVRTEQMTADLSNYKIYVVAEGCQAAGFDDAYTALNTAFGTPGSYTPATWTSAAAGN